MLQNLSNDATTFLLGLELSTELMDYVVSNKTPNNKFLIAVLSNDLIRAVEKASTTNLEELPKYTKFLTQYVPNDCYGSIDKIDSWSGNKYHKWALEIKTLLIEKLNISNSDAQGILDKEFFTVAQEWSLGRTAIEATDRITNLNNLLKGSG